MNIIIPMAGRGSRLRPHTLTVPKPLMPIAGKPIVQRLVEDLAATSGEVIENIGFVIGDFGKEVEAQLYKIAQSVGANGHIYTQGQPLGTAHAILCAKELLRGNVIVGFADTLFKANFQLSTKLDGIIWTHRVEDPSRFGVVQLDANNTIVEFVEKPQQFVSDMAIIGIYYFKDGADLKNELQYLLDNDIKEKGEYQLTTALENMKQKGIKFGIASVTEWLDCGNKDACVYTNQRILEFSKQKGEKLISSVARIENSTIIEPCYIGTGVVIKNAVVGPHVSIGQGSTVTGSVIANSLIQNQTHVLHKVITDSMIGSFAHIKGQTDNLSVGDYSVVQ